MFKIEGEDEKNKIKNKKYKIKINQRFNRMGHIKYTNIITMESMNIILIKNNHYKSYKIKLFDINSYTIFLILFILYYLLNFNL